jgi:SAM-dependent methyltransferase
MMTTLYRWKVQLLKTHRGNYLWRRIQGMRGNQIGNYNHLPEYVRRFAPGKSFADIGCMWGVNGEFSFIAEEAGATSIKGVDVFGPTPEFTEKKQKRNSRVEFILGDATHPDTLAKVGKVDVVFCAGVLYHHPAPFDLLVALRRICKETLILRSSTIPEMTGLPNGAIYFPALAENDRKLWNLSRLGLLKQVGITNEFQPAEGYGNWFWGLTPSCLVALLGTAGFRVDYRATEPFAQTVVCTAVAVPFQHRLPGQNEARRLAAEISVAGIAKPA